MAVDFSGEDIQSIENALQVARPGGWWRLDAATLGRFMGIAPRAGWLLAVPKGQFASPTVDRLYVLIDAAFPYSEPRVVAPSLKLGEWPHVEADGVLCLKPTTWEASPGDRVVGTLGYAAAVLDMDDAKRKEEFAREFVAYWRQLESAGADVPFFVTLMPPQAPSRELVFARSSRLNRIALGDDPASLTRWLENSGESRVPKAFRRTRMVWLPEPWIPSQFPQRVNDVTNAVGTGVLNPYLQTDESLPVLFGTATPSGNVFVGVDVPAMPRKQFKKGFRASSNVPGVALAAVSAGHLVRRCRVERGDPAWVHGRGRNPQQALLFGKRVGIVGCGALGGATARLLAQMGVGNFVLVDGDDLTTANTSRHVLGAGSVRENKANAVGHLLQRDFPHIASVESVPVRFQQLDEAQLARLASCDLVLSAGIDWAGDLALDRWRRGLTAPPVHTCAWAEEFALAGHALALFGDDSIAPGFSIHGLPHIRLTEWPPQVQTKVIEAGCGNSFQPHGAVDLSDCVTLAAKLILDVLTQEITASCRRAWLGDRQQVERLGGTARAEFDVSYARKVFPWPPGAP